MRTTVKLDDHLLSQAKQLANRTNRTLSAVIEDALREVLARTGANPREPVDLPTFGGSGVRPGFDLNDPGSWAEFLDAADAKEQLENDQRAAG